MPQPSDTQPIPCPVPKRRARHVLIEWHGMILRADIVGYEDQELTVHTRGFVPPAGSRVSVRRALSLRSNGVPKSISLWLIDRVVPCGGNHWHIVLVR